MRMNPTMDVSTMPSPGALLGTSGTSQLIESINNTLGHTEWFNSAQNAFSQMHNAFVQNVIQPIRQATNAISSTAVAFLNPDYYRPLTTEEDLKAIPPVMWMPILMDEPVRELHRQGRIDGFGFDPGTIPKEDPYGRLINNGRIDDVLTPPPNDAQYHEMTYVWDTDDPALTSEELDAIEETRSFLRMLIDTKGIDPTSYPNSIM